MTEVAGRRRVEGERALISTALFHERWVFFVHREAVPDDEGHNFKVSLLYAEVHL